MSDLPAWLPVIEKHWRRGSKAYGRPGECIVAHVWWPLDDPCPAEPLWP